MTTTAPPRPFLASRWETETLDRLAAYAHAIYAARNLCNLLEEFAPGILETQRAELQTRIDAAYKT